MNNLTKLTLLEQYLATNEATTKFTVPFLSRKNPYNVELQNWADYQDLRKGIITFRQSGIRVKAPDYYPCLTYNPVIPIIYDQGYRYLNQQELLELQSFPPDHQFPLHYSLTKLASLLGNAVNIKAVKHFVNQQNIQVSIKFIDLFGGIGGFHYALKDYGQCVLAVDISQNSQTTYSLNFPTTPFLLGDINSKKIQKQIMSTEFDLLCAGFPCQPFSRAGGKNGTSKELDSLLQIIKKRPSPYILLETVPNFLTSPSLNKLVKGLLGYRCSFEIINPKDLGVKQNRPRLFIWAEKSTNHA